jgi:hypothetical protein
MELNEEVSVDDLTLNPSQSLDLFKPKPRNSFVAMTVAVAVGKGGFRGRTKLEEKGKILIELIVDK